MLVIYTSALIVAVVIFDNLIPIIASSELDVIIVLAVVPIATSPNHLLLQLSRNLGPLIYLLLFILYHSATAIAITKPAEAPAAPLEADVIRPFASTVKFVAV